MAQLIETMNVEHLSGTDYIRSKKRLCFQIVMVIIGVLRKREWQ
ncbi:hypothetical protein N422_06840 [Lacticaseibacillus paracasei]|nr:hypothetical protein N422_06840 [Lacticaseibacillus paracasei]